VTLVKAAPTTTMMATCTLTISVRSASAWRNTSSGPETVVRRGWQKRSCASLAITRSVYVLACPALVRWRKPYRVHAASFDVAWVR
jgi:hypothetical protein